MYLEFQGGHDVIVNGDMRHLDDLSPEERPETDLKPGIAPWEAHDTVDEAAILVDLQAAYDEAITNGYSRLKIKFEGKYVNLGFYVFRMCRHFGLGQDVRTSLMEHVVALVKSFETRRGTSGGIGSAAVRDTHHDAMCQKKPWDGYDVGGRASGEYLQN